MGAIVFIVFLLLWLGTAPYALKFIEWAMKPYSKKTLKDFMKEV